MGHVACKGIVLRSLAKPQAHGTTSACFLTYGVLNYIRLGQEGTLWIFSCNYQSRFESDLLWLLTNHQLSGGGGKGSLENKVGTSSGFSRQ